MNNYINYSLIIENENNNNKSFNKNLNLISYLICLINQLFISQLLYLNFLKLFFERSYKFVQMTTYSQYIKNFMKIRQVFFEKL